MIRVFKNARSKMIEDEVIAEAPPPILHRRLAPHAPDPQFLGDYQDIFLKILNWLYETKDQTKFVTANEQYYYCRTTAACRACADGKNFINAAINLRMVGKHPDAGVRSRGYPTEIFKHYGYKPYWEERGG